MKKLNLSKFPEEVQQFVAALVENAKQVEGWSEPTLEGGQCFAETIPYVKSLPNGSVMICDNYERFFGLVYTYTRESGVNKWTVRRMGEEAVKAREYTFGQCMADASIMFTG